MKTLKRFALAALAVAALLPLAATGPQSALAGCNPDISLLGCEQHVLNATVCTVDSADVSSTLDINFPTFIYDLNCSGHPSIHANTSYGVHTKTAYEYLTTDTSQLQAQWTCPADPWTTITSFKCSDLQIVTLTGNDFSSFVLGHQPTTPFSVLFLDAHSRQVLGPQLLRGFSPPPIADLQVASIQISDKNGVTGCGAGDGNTVSVVVPNSGNAAPKPADLLLRYFGGERTLPGAVTAAPGQDQQLVFEHIPMTSGVSSLGAVVNPDLVNGTGGVPESDSTNNYLSVAVTCATQPASLQVASLQILNNGVEIQDSSGKPACLSGPNNRVRVRVSNGGDTDPGVVDLQLLVDNKPAGTASMGGVGPHSDKLSSFDTMSLTLGSHALQVVIDPKGKAIKSDQLTVTCTAPPQ